MYNVLLYWSIWLTKTCTGWVYGQGKGFVQDFVICSAHYCRWSVVQMEI